MRSLGGSTAYDTIECDEYVSHPPAAAWRALTESDLLAQWWASGDVEPVPGHRFQLDMGPWGRQACQVLAADPDRLLTYTFGDGSLDTTITWRLVPEGTGTSVFLTHKGFDLQTPLGRQAYDGMGMGWPSVLARIAQAVPAGTPARGSRRSAVDHVRKVRVVHRRLSRTGPPYSRGTPREALTRASSGLPRG